MPREFVAMNKFPQLSALLVGSVILTMNTGLVIGQEEEPIAKGRLKARPAAPAEAEKKAAEQEAPAATVNGTKTVGKTTDPEQLLTDRGLTKDNRKFLLDESAAIEKFAEAKTLYAKFQDAMVKYSKIVEYDENLANLAMQSQMMQQEANMLQQQINNTAANAGRLRLNANAQLAPMRQQQSMTAAQANRLKAEYKTLEGKAPKPAERDSAVAEVDSTREAYVDSVHELAELVTPLMAEYHELGLDKSVVDALDQLRRKTTLNYKLGPSDELRSAAKVIKDLKLNTAGPARTKSATKKKAKSTGSP
jgi:hypothetical protein